MSDRACEGHTCGTPACCRSFQRAHSAAGDVATGWVWHSLHPSPCSTVPHTNQPPNPPTALQGFSSTMQMHTHARCVCLL
jgi:hypothetical protein